MIRRSRYYPAEKSWTRSPAWAFEVPLAAIENSSEHETVILKCEKQNSHEYLILNVPIDFFKQHIEVLYTRKDHQTVSLFLSAMEQNMFTDLRGRGKVSFKGFLHRD
jgi:hypothetical protein